MKDKIKNIIFVLIGIAFTLSLVIAGFRINAETQHRMLQLGVRYEDVLKIATVENQSLEEVLAELKALGITTLFVKENTVDSQDVAHLTSDVAQGLVEVKDGSDVLNGNPQLTYVIGKDKETITRIYEHFTQKGINVSLEEAEGMNQIGLQTSDKEVLTKVGTGFIEEDLQQAANLGYVISPEIRGWDAVTKSSITWEIEQIRQIPALSYIYFQDYVIPGYSEEAMVELIKEKGLGFTEFYSPKQEGFDTLANLTKDEANNYQIIRRFTDEKVENISTPNPVARYELALTERGIRAFTFILDDEETIEDYKHTIVSFKESAEAKGYLISGDKQVYTYKETPLGLLFLIGIGTLAATVLLMSEMKCGQVGIGIGCLAVFGYGVGIVFATAITVQAMALLTTIVFPTYGIIKHVKETNVPSYKTACIGFFKITGTTFIGCVLLVGLLSQANYALGIDGFRGVKIAHIIPLLGVGSIFIYRYRKTIKKEMQDILGTHVSYGPLLVGGLVVAVAMIFFIYIMRTGNGEISELEKWVRQGLDSLLGVRPRTKEFLIGHPLMIGLLYFGYKNMYWPVLILGTIGQISLMNTYAHIHTPLMVSLIRSAYGIGIGIIIGIILIQVVKFIFKVINKWIIKQK